MNNYDYSFDVVVVGSGAAGLTAAWTAKRAALSVVVLEKANVFGGNTALSGGGAWMPNTPVMLRSGQRDDPEALLTYLQAVAPAVDPERQRRFLEEAPKLHAALEATPDFHDGFAWVRGYSDYHPELGGNPEGRGIWPKPVDHAVIGEDALKLRSPKAHMDMPKGTQRLWVTISDFRDVVRMKWDGWSFDALKTTLRFAGRIAMGTIRQRYMATAGRALVIRLRSATQRAGVPLWLQTPLKSLLTESGAVIGVLAEQNGKPLSIKANRGVIIAAGGFEFNRELRSKYHPYLPPITLSAGAESNTGDGIVAGEAIGAATELMDSAWWTPVSMLPSGPQPAVWECQSPYQFMVNGAGVRFVNESSPYSVFGQAQIDGQNTGVTHIPAYMIMDDYGWSRCLVGSHRPGTPLPQDWIEHGSMFVADSLEELAQKIGVPPAQLVATAARYNEFARNGRDLDFHRGESPYDHFFGNPRLENPNLAEVKQAPFYAIKIGLGDLGTKGGLLTNPNAQVLNREGRVIPGLYAAGNSSASIMGYNYAGPGATIGPAMTFAWIAANTIARNT